MLSEKEYSSCVVAMSLYKPEISMLSSAVESILNQSYRDFLFVITVDGSLSRECKLYLNSLEDNRLRLKYFLKNKGLASCLNWIVSNYGFEYLIRMDADDVSYLGRIKRSIDYLKNNPTCLVLSCNYTTIDSQGNTIGQSCIPSKKRYLDQSLKNGVNAIAHPGAVVRRSFFEMYKYDESIRRGQDLDLWLRAWKELGPEIFYILPDVLIYYRVHSAATTQRSESFLNSWKLGLSLLLPCFVIKSFKIIKVWVWKG